MKRLLTLLLLLAAVPAAAIESTPVASARAVATLVTDSDAITADTPFRAALRLRLAQGWHTYWKNPGDAGVAPELTIQDAKASPIDWPTPRRVAEGPVMTYAYTGEVLLPVTLTARPGRLKAHAEWLVCKDICVPEEGDFALDLPQGAPAPSAHAALFAAHDRAVPRPSPWTARIAADGTLFVQGQELTPATVTDAWFIPDEPGRIQDDAAQPLSVRNGGFTLTLRTAQGFDAAKGLSGVLSVRDRAGLQSDVLLSAPAGDPPGPALPALPLALAFAFLGGLILNLMPCVFPILAMKAVSLAAHRGRGPALAYTAGVLTAFISLAAALLAARSAGQAAGWGFQFSAPAFVAAMTWLMLAIGLNLSGVFQVGGGLAGAGSGLAGRSGAIGTFFTGLLAVLVATPCTAPFMGAAIAAGLAAPAPITLLVFAVMGLGLATPYAALASLPALARWLPKPGGWMEVLKQALAFPMYATAAWLLWVVSQEAGSAGVLVTGVGLVLTGFAAWAFGAAQRTPARPRRLGQVIALAAVMAAAALLPGLGAAAPSALETAETFAPARLAALRAAGKPVFVNMTAAWCVTCLVNERVAIGTEAVQKAFADHGVAYLKGDWTRQDASISTFLRQNGRDGVPLYIFYPRGNGQPEVLPQILTESEMLRLLTAA